MVPGRAPLPQAESDPAWALVQARARALVTTGPVSASASGGVAPETPVPALEAQPGQEQGLTRAS